MFCSHLSRKGICYKNSEDPTGSQDGWRTRWEGSAAKNNLQDHSTKLVGWDTPPTPPHSQWVAERGHAAPGGIWALLSAPLPREPDKIQGTQFSWNCR